MLDKNSREYKLTYAMSSDEVEIARELLVGWRMMSTLSNICEYKKDIEFLTGCLTETPGPFYEHCDSIRKIHWLAEMLINEFLALEEQISEKDGDIMDGVVVID